MVPKLLLHRFGERLSTEAAAAGVDGRALVCLSFFAEPSEDRGGGLPLRVLG